MKKDVLGGTRERDESKRVSDEAEAKKKSSEAEWRSRRGA